MKLRYFSHSSFQITTDSGLILLIDPFLDDNPTSPVSSADLSADFIVLTHAHGDHIGDSFKIAKRVDPLFICVNELANYCIDKSIQSSLRKKYKITLISDGIAGKTDEKTNK